MPEPYFNSDLVHRLVEYKRAQASCRLMGTIIPAVKAASPPAWGSRLFREGGNLAGWRENRERLHLEPAALLILIFKSDWLGGVTGDEMEVGNMREWMVKWGE